MIDIRNRRRGFTIVELLIVIVVIAILAAIVIVAYTGIQNKAHAAAAQAASNTITKLLTNSYTLNGTYPADLSTINNGSPMPSTDGSTYVYHPGAGNSSYCVTVTNGGASYKVTDTATQPTAGGCPGDGQGGVAPITNLVTNPSVETNTAGMSGLYGASGAGTASRVGGTGQSEANYFRVAWTTPPTSMTSAGLWISSNASTPSAAGRTYTASGYLRSSWAGGIFSLNLVPYTSAWVYAGGEVYGPQITLSANTWTRFTATITAPASTDNMTVRLRAAGGTLPGAGATLDADAFMLTEGSNAPNYADGNSPNWIWNGTANNSSSTGPSQ